MTAFASSGVEKITNGDERPISSQNEEGEPSSQLPGEETEDEDDQNKAHEKPPLVIIDLVSESLFRLQLGFMERHHEVITPPPQVLIAA